MKDQDDNQAEDNQAEDNEVEDNDAEDNAGESEDHQEQPHDDNEVCFATENVVFAIITFARSDFGSALLI